MAKEKKKKGEKNTLGAEDTPGAIAVWTQRARGWGLLVGFGVAFLMSYRAGLPLVDAALRGILGALVMSLIAWWCALIVIQGLIRTALTRRNEEREKAYAEMLAAQEAAAATTAADLPGGGLFDDNMGFPS